MSTEGAINVQAEIVRTCKGAWDQLLTGHQGHEPLAILKDTFVDLADRGNTWLPGRLEDDERFAELAAELLLNDPDVKEGLRSFIVRCIRAARDA